MKMMMQEEIRKGPWTEQEDLILINFVHLFGDRRWDFIAKVSGLKVAGDPSHRTGKSCRLRWVNYLHPGLKRGKMTPPEEKLVLELHAKWGNRWSRIARKLPGRTDNEIKNYWRTHTRKKAQEKKRAASPSISNCSSSSSSNKSSIIANSEVSFYDTGGLQEELLQQSSTAKAIEELAPADYYNMDDIWKDIENVTSIDQVPQGGGFLNSFIMPDCVSPNWDVAETLWKFDEGHESKNTTFLIPNYDYGIGTSFLSG